MRIGLPLSHKNKRKGRVTEEQETTKNAIHIGDSNTLVKSGLNTKEKLKVDLIPEQT